MLKTFIYDYGDWGRGDIIGRLESDGVVFDDSDYGNAIGRVESDGLIFDDFEYGNVVGRVEFDGLVFDAERGGNAVGHVCSDGYVIDEYSNNCIGYLESDYQTLSKLATDLQTLNDLLPGKRPEIANPFAGSGEFSLQAAGAARLLLFR